MNQFYHQDRNQIVMERSQQFFDLYHACCTLTEQYRWALVQTGRRYGLPENAMQVLVHLAMHPEANTQKLLKESGLSLSVSTISRMTELLQDQDYLSLMKDTKDHRSYLITMAPKGAMVTAEFRRTLSESLRMRPGMHIDYMIEWLHLCSSSAADNVQALHD